MQQFYYQGRLYYLLYIGMKMSSYSMNSLSKCLLSTFYQVLDYMLVTQCQAAWSLPRCSVYGEPNLNRWSPFYSQMELNCQ